MIEDEYKITSSQIKLLRNGDCEQFKLLFDLYSKDLLLFLISILKSKEEAAEALQDTFVKLWEKREDLKFDTSMKSFLFTIALNYAKMNLRKRKYFYKYSEYIKSQPDPISNYNPDHSDINNLYQQAISQLPSERKKIYLLCKQEHLTYAEVADKLNISIKTVENQMTKSIKFLRFFFQGYSEMSVILSFFLFCY